MKTFTLLLITGAALLFSGLANAIATHCPAVDDFKNGTVCPTGWNCTDSSAVTRIPSGKSVFQNAAIDPLGITCEYHDNYIKKQAWVRMQVMNAKPYLPMNWNKLSDGYQCFSSDVMACSFTFEAKK